MTTPRTRRRSKLAPDPDVRHTIVASAGEVLRDNGVRGMSVAAVLDRAGLSTRAFYRHFTSRDELLAAVFFEFARVERRRLVRKMSRAADPAAAVAAWIDGRLDLAFDGNVRSELRRLSSEAQTQMLSAPELVQPAFAEMLAPLVDQLSRGSASGVFRDIDPPTEAQSVQGVVWANTQRHWMSTDHDTGEIRERVVRFCLRGLGVTTAAIDQIIGI